ncbi:MAG: hypothetical protein IJB91_06825 [Oscillospiraceae bacterium]|nr:hypothetical protein [Oscillospiraceae bacterium]
MSIDPKKGGKCWSCKHCEDIATQTHNEQGAYYRKCTKSGHEYIDTCRFSCSDYVWDGKDPAFAPPAPAASPAVNASAPTPAKKSSAVYKLISALLTTGIFGFLGYLLWEYTKYFLVSAAGGNATIPLLDDALTLEGILILAPFVLTILWSIIRRRKIWIGGLITIIACVAVNGVLGDDTTLAHMPLYLVCLAVPFILCLVAILKEKKVSVSTASTSSSSSKASAAPTAARTYTDYQCYQCAYYKVDADYNGICTRNNALVDRYQTACKNCTR